MDVNPIFSSFAAGEIDGKLHARTDIKAADHGAAELRGLIGSVKGPAVTRGGSRELLDIEGSNARLIARPFEDKGDVTFLFKEDGNFVMASPSGRAKYDDVIFAPGASMPTGYGTTVTGDASVEIVPGGIVLTANNEGTAQVVLPMLDAPTNFTTQPHAFTVRFAEVLPPSLDEIETGDEDLFPASADVEVGLYNITAGAPVSTSVVSGTDCVRGYGESVATTSQAGLYVKLTAGATQYQSGRVSKPVQITIVSYGMFDTNVAQDEFAHPYDSEDLPFLNFCSNPIDGTIYITHWAYAPRVLEVDVGGDPVINTISFTSAPAEWGADNYPTVCTFFQGRSWWAGNPANSNYIWASQSGAPTDLTTGAAADDAIAFYRIKPCFILNLTGASSVNALLVNTDKDEFLITSSSGVVVTNSTIAEKVQSDKGSSRVPVVDVGDRVIYAGRSGTRLWEAWYEWTYDIWKSRPINFVGAHLFDGKNIKEIHFARLEELILFVVFRDGTACIGVYDQPNEIINFQPYNCSRTIVTATVLTYTNADYLMFVTKGRDYTGDDYLFLEEYTTLHPLDHFTELTVDTSGVYPWVWLRTKSIEDIAYRSQVAALDGFYTYYLNNWVYPITQGGWNLTSGSYACDTDVDNTLILDADTNVQALDAGLGVRIDFVSTDGSAVTLRALDSSSNVIIPSTVIESGDFTLPVSGANKLDRIELTSPGDYRVTKIGLAASESVLVSNQQLFDYTRQCYTSGRRGSNKLGVIDFDTFVTATQMTMPVASPIAAIGMGFEQKLVTLQPKLDSVTGTGRNAMRGVSEIEVGLLRSAKPLVNGAVPVKLDDTVYYNGDSDEPYDRYTGKVSASRLGTSRQTSVELTLNTPDELVITEIILNMAQNTI